MTIRILILAFLSPLVWAQECDLQRSGLNRVYDDQDVILSEHTETQTTIESAVNRAMQDGGEKRIEWADMRVNCTLPTEEEPDPIPDPDPDPPVPGGQVTFTEISTPAHGSGDSWFGSMIQPGKVSLIDHQVGGNDPMWDYADGVFTYAGQLSQPASIRHARTIKLSDGIWPVSGFSGLGTKEQDMLHRNGEVLYLCGKQWGYVECQAFGDANGDGIDDIYWIDSREPTGFVYDGATIVPGATQATGTIIGQGIPSFASSTWTKAACIWQDRVLTEKGLYDLQGNQLTAIPTATPAAGEPAVKGGFACGDFDGDGDTDVAYYSGSRILLENTGDSFTQVSSNLPGAGDDLRYNIPSTPNLNGDTCADLVLDDVSKAYVSNCDMTFTEALDWDQGELYMTHADTGDLDGNGLDDICATTGTPSVKCFLTNTIAAESDEPAEPVVPSDGFDKAAFALTQYHTFYKNRPFNQAEVWLYDPVQFLYELCAETGDTAVCADAKDTALLYVQHYADNGQNPGWPGCNGGWSYAGVDKCDSKFTYASPIYYLHTVEGVPIDRGLTARLEDYLWHMGWAGFQWTALPADWDWQTFNFTERTAAYSLMGLTYLCALDQPSACDKVSIIVAWLADFQDRTPTGFMLHSYNLHEGSQRDPDALIGSPFMSAMLSGALVRAQKVRPDPRIPVILNKLAQAMLVAIIYDPPSWSHRENKTSPVWFTPYIYVHENPAFFESVQNNHWFSDQHNPEVWCAIKAGGLEPPSLQGFEGMATVYYDRRPSDPNTNYRIAAWMAHDRDCYGY